MEDPREASAPTGPSYETARAAIAAVPPDPALRGVAQALERICRASVSHLHLAGAAIQLVTDQEPHGVAAASDARAESLCELEFILGEGPGLDACRLRRPVLVSDLEFGSGDRWLGYPGSALQAGVAAVFALPLSLGATGFGVLELYSAGPGPLSPDETAMALFFAQIGVEALLDSNPAPDGWLDSDVALALHHRAEIAQAQGMVMVDLGVTLAEALAVLRSHAYAHNLRLIDLARAVIAGQSLAGETDA